MTDITKQLAEALDEAIDLIDMLDGKDNSCDERYNIDDLRRILAAYRAHRVGWQPIETAPKDGTTVLAWNFEFGSKETRNITYTPGSPGFEAGLKDRWWEWLEPKNGWALKWKPTHWMPLPAPPYNESNE